MLGETYMNIYYIPSLPVEHSDYFNKTKYSKWYFNIISNALKRGTKKPRKGTPYYVYYESHHILPKAKCMFPHYSSFKQHPWNQVLLTAKEHYICHLLLIKMTSGKAKGVMYLSLTKMIAQPRNSLKLSSKGYQYFREKYSNSMCGENNPMFGKKRITSKETRDKLSKAGKGRMFSNEHKKKISESNKGRTLSQERKEKIGLMMSKLHKGKKFTEEHKRKIAEANRKRKIIQHYN
jgi:hypothetical protein